MEAFRSTYREKCAELGVEPNQAILSTLVHPRPLAQAQQQQGMNQDGTDRARQAYHPTELLLSSQPLGFKGVKALCAALQPDVVFTRLVLADAFLGDEGIILLADALKTNGTLLHLDVRSNSIRNDGAIALAGLLKVNSTLQALLLEWNCVGVFDSGMHALAESLTFNQALQHLDLRNNKVSGTGAAMLAKALRHNTSLRRLDVRWNSIGTMGARAFIDMLRVNIVLHELELTGNDVSEDALRAVTASLLKNAERHKLDLESRAASTYLSSALQAITSEHAQTLSTLSGKLGEAEEHGKTLSMRLQAASEEITGSHDAYKTLLAKWELVQRQKADLEAAVMEERKEMATLTSTYQRDLLNEREKRMALEDRAEQQHRNGDERILVLEAKLRDAELNAEVLRRDKKLLLTELEEARAKELRGVELYKDKIASIESHHHAQLLQLQDSKDRDFLEKSRILQERVRELEELQGEAGRGVQAMKAKWLTERQQLLKEVENTEYRVRQEEEHKRREAMRQLEHLATQKDALQNEVTAMSMKHAQALKDQELDNIKFQQQRISLNDQLAELRVRIKEIASYEDKYQELVPEAKRSRERAEALQAELDGVKGQLAQKDALAARLRDELRRREEEMEEMDQENAVKMKELQLNVMSLLNLQPRRHHRNKSGNVLDSMG